MPYEAPDPRGMFDLVQEMEAQAERLGNRIPRNKLTREAIVMIWKNNITGGRWGHAAIKYRNDGNNGYASWWPDGAGRPFKEYDGEHQTLMHERRGELNYKTNDRLLAGEFQARDG